MSSPALPSLIESYQSGLSAGTLRFDPVQERALLSLQRLYDDLRVSSFWDGGKKRKKILFFNNLKQSIRGIYLHGGVGRGKSMLMDLFYAALPETLPKWRVHFHDFMIGVHDYLHTRRESQETGEGVDATLPLFAARIAEKARVLCFDEFHVTDVADAMILGRLFRCLFEQGVVVVATSNWPPDTLYEGGLQRDRFLPFIALLKEKMETVFLDSPTDYRKVAQGRGGVYLSPLCPETDEKLERVFEAFAGHKIQYETDRIEIKGREIQIERAMDGMARFSFAALCEKPHGAEDYGAIAQKYHTIFLENIPRLGYDRRNEAKRLMILIDTLYEHKTRLVISAECPPDKLYRGHDHAFEFDRTISRLCEMQGQGQ